MAVNEPLKYFGVERKLFGLSLIVSALIASQGSKLLGLAVATALLSAAKYLTRRDDRMLQILWFLWRQGTHYDPIKRQVFQLEMVEERLEEE